MKKLAAAAYSRARTFLQAQARPLERARFAQHFEGASARPVLDALAAFRNADGGFGRALEPDLRQPESSPLATETALELLRESGAPASEPLVRGAVLWLVERFEPELPGWRAVSQAAESHPHAPHWAWELHRPGGPWDPVIIPSARVLSHLLHWDGLAPRELVTALELGVRAHVGALRAPVPADSLVYAASVALPELRAHVRALAPESVTREPAAWSGYCAKPLKLAPAPDAPLAEVLAAETAANLDWEIGRQEADGGWSPNWTWQGRFPADWERARREWRGELTLALLRSLRAYGRIEGL